MNKGVVTQSSAAIPIIPLYIALLYKIMKDKKTHEGCIEQIHRLFKDRLYSDSPLQLDDQERIRIDDIEMSDEVQLHIASQWGKINTETVQSIADIEEYRSEFLKLFGFGIPSVDYEADVDPSESF